jgi:hypothetical protein
MRALTTEEARGWCREHRVEIGESGKPHLDGSRAKGIRLLLPSEPDRLPYLVVSLLDVEVNELDQLSGVEHLLWFRAWDMWPELVTSIGLEQLEILKRGLGIGEAISERPAILFSGTEIKSLVSCVPVPLIFAWDCYVIPSSAEHLVFISHDQWVRVSARDEATESRLVDELRRWGPGLHDSLT